MYVQAGRFDDEEDDDYMERRRRKQRLQQSKDSYLDLQQQQQQERGSGSSHKPNTKRQIFYELCQEIENSCERHNRKIGATSAKQFMNPQQYLEESIQHFCKSRPGYMSMKEFVTVLKDIDIVLDASQLDIIFDTLDPQGVDSIKTSQLVELVFDDDAADLILGGVGALGRGAEEDDRHSLSGTSRGGSNSRETTIDNRMTRRHFTATATAGSPLPLGDRDRVGT